MYVVNNPYFVVKKIPPAINHFGVQFIGLN